MHLHHIALWTNRLEELRAFYLRYFGGTGGEKYVNPTCGRRAIRSSASLARAATATSRAWSRTPTASESK